MPADRKHLVRPRWFSTSSTATTNSSSPMLLGWQSAVVSMGNLCFNIAISNKFNWRLLLKQRWCNQPLSSTVRNIHPVLYISLAQRCNVSMRDKYHINVHKICTSAKQLHTSSTNICLQWKEYNYFTKYWQSIEKYSHKYKSIRVHATD